MNKIYILLFALIVPISLISQNSYYYKNGKTYLTAKKLDSIFNTSALKSSEGTHCIKPEVIDEILWLCNVKEFSEKNPFFSDYGFQGFLDDYEICDPEDRTEKISPGRVISLSSKSSDSNANLDWQSAILLGTADFMAQRFKDELVNYALKQLIDNVKDENLSSVRILFPKTIKYIDNVLEPNQKKGFYYSDLEMLRYHAELDLKDIAFQLPEFINEVSGKKNNLITFSTKILSNSSIYSDPLEIFNELSRVNFDYTPNTSSSKPVIIENEYTKINNLEIEKQLYLLDLFVNALRTESDNTDLWINFSEVNPKNIKSDLTVRFYYALLYEQTKNLNGFNDPFLEDELFRLTQKAATSFKTIDNAYNKIVENDSALLEADYTNLLKSVFKTIDSFKPKDTPQLNNILELTFSIQHSITEHKYQYILPNIFLILDELDIENTLLDREVLNTLVLLLDFTMVENAEQMKNLLSTYALPIGSSSLKRTGKFDISFNGYVGLTGGYEVLDGDFDNSFFNVGLTAPIGVAFSHRYNTDGFISSGSIFLGILDIGALVNNSFDDAIEVESDLSFKQFFVPSLGYFFNINNSPFSFGLTGSYHIDSRAFKDQTLESEQIDSYRLNFSVLVDIPFFTLKHKN